MIAEFTLADKLYRRGWEDNGKKDYDPRNTDEWCAVVDLITALRKEIDAKQAKIDSLMFEYCPEEMTDEQIAEWGKHQVRA